jgi:fumarylacetoacetase
MVLISENSMQRSFIDIPEGSHFPIQNLPYGIFSTATSTKRVGVAIGEYVLDLALLQTKGFLPGVYFQGSTLNSFLATGRAEWSRVRSILQHLLDFNTSTLRDDTSLRSLALIPRSQVTLHLPVEIGDYTDFYSSKQHATNVGSMFRDPTNPLLPNWTHLPVAYHGRSSSIVVSGTDIKRPWGQIKPAESAAPLLSPSRQMDFELEVGYIIGKGNKLGEPIPVDQASEHVFGMVLVNDWSARDIQSWEYVPLGPFLGKNFATSISPWIVPLDALEEFRVEGQIQDPKPLPYLLNEKAQSYNIDLEVRLGTPEQSGEAVISRVNFKTLYWNIAQQIAHHTVNGCNLQVGDLLASGTVSGDTPDSYGSLLELTWRGSKPLQLPDGNERTFLQDGDRVTLSASASGNGYTIGFGEVVGTIVSASNRES